MYESRSFTGVYTVKIPAGASSAQFNVATIDEMPAVRCNSSATCSTTCPAQVPSDQDYVDQVVERARKEFNVPGIAVAIAIFGSHHIAVLRRVAFEARKLGHGRGGVRARDPRRA